MERDIFFYVGRALERSGAKSERALCGLLGLNSIAITSYRRGTLPTDETMEKLAKIAGIDPQLALIDLNIWRTTGPAQAAYKRMLEKFGVFIALCGVVVALLAAPSSAKAASLNLTHTIHYHTNLMKSVFLKLLSRLRNSLKICASMPLSTQLVTERV